jgi:glycosyltransferase involved in cell wall biosynthesis
MNILLISPFQPFQFIETGGVCIAVEMLYHEFCKKGHQVSIIVPGDRNRIIPLGDMKDIPIYSAYFRIPLIKKSFIRGFIAFCIFLPFTLYEIHRFLIRKKIDVVAIQYPQPWLFYFVILRYLCSWKLVVTLQGSDVHELPLMSWMDRNFVRWVLVAADSVIAVSKSLLDKLYFTFPQLLIKSCVVPNGVPENWASRSSFVGPSDGIPQEYILTVGKLIHRKGIDILIKALKIALDQGHAINLVIVGEGQERQKLLLLAKEYGLSGYVYFVGNQPHEKVLEFLKSSLFFVLASRAEGLPLVILEAMGCGKAVVATKVDGIPEIIEDGRTGFLVEPEDPQSLAKAIIRLYRDPKQRHSLARQSQEQVIREYSWEAIATRYLNIFAQ